MPLKPSYAKGGCTSSTSLRRWKLVETAVRLADHALALADPRDRWFVRFGMWFENARRSRKTGFRSFAHPPMQIEQVIQRAGFELRQKRTTAVWSIELFTRCVGAP